MRDFEEIYAISADRKGGATALEALLSTPLTSAQLATTADHQWLEAMAVIDNARFIQELASENGSAGAFFGNWPSESYIDLLALLTKRGARLGSVTGQRMLRIMGRDGFILSADVVARLVAEGVVDKAPTSKRDLSATQGAFNEWSNQSGRSLTHISQILAFSV